MQYRRTLLWHGVEGNVQTWRQTRNLIRDQTEPDLSPANGLSFALYFAKCRSRLSRITTNYQFVKFLHCLTIGNAPSNHFEDKKVPVHESLVTECRPGIGMVVLIQ